MSDASTPGTRPLGALVAHADLRRPARHLRAGPGHGALRRRRHRVPRLHHRPRRGVAGSRPPGRGRCGGRAGQDTQPRVEPVRQHTGARGRPHHRPPHQRRHRPGRGSGLLRQLGRRGERVRAQAGPPLGRPRPPRRDQRRQRVPRPHAGHADRHRAAREAGAVRAAARGFRARALRRRRRAGQGARPRHGRRRPAGAAAGRGRGHGPELGLPGRGASTLHRAQRAAHARRGADRPRADRALVRLPGAGARARRGDDGQGPRQRHAGRRLLGPGGGGGGLRSGRPRIDVRRTAPRPGRGQGDAGRDGVRGRSRRAREQGERLADGLARLPGVVSVRGAGLLLAAQLDGAGGQGGGGLGVGARPVGEPRAARRHPRGTAPAGARRRDRHGARGSSARRSPPRCRRGGSR